MRGGGVAAHEILLEQRQRLAPGLRQRGAVLVGRRGSARRRGQASGACFRRAAARACPPAGARRGALPGNCAHRCIIPAWGRFKTMAVHARLDRRASQPAARTRPPARGWLDDRLAQPPALGDVDGRPDQHDRRSARASRRSCSSTASRAAGRTGSSSSPRSPASHRVVALDLPGFGHSPGHAGEVSMPGYARILDGRCSAARASTRAVARRQLDGRPDRAPSSPSPFPQRVERLVLVSPAGIATYRNRLATRSMPAMRRAQQLLALGAAGPRRTSDALARGRALRELVLQGVVAHPRRLPGAARRRAAARRRHRRLHVGAGGDPRLRPAPAPRADPLPDAGRVGHEGQADHGARRARFAEAIPGAREVVYEDTGHMAMLERPREFNELLPSRE